MPRPSALTGDPGEGEAQVAPPGSLMHREPCALQTPGAGLPGEDDPPVVRGGGGTLEVLGAGQAAEGQAGGRPVAPAGGGDGPPREADPDPEGLNPPRGPGSLTLKNVFCSHRESPFLSRSGSVLASPRECSPPLQLCGLQDGGRACLLIVSCVCGHHLPGFPLITLKKDLQDRNNKLQASVREQPSSHTPSLPSVSGTSCGQAQEPSAVLVLHPGPRPGGLCWSSLLLLTHGTPWLVGPTANVSVPV
ncbi:uncharacterized protein LOC122682169 isoform X2 [Cervus elaphus]|uniref:uncharacterized protein LOC122682169 isoform X2 n=1 Tax=Cervus elaphus TaxID=9860 RepID=UPI001CC3164E|nr:uncharacterized protein LOC122682169 isoform X2 [Cervus elaphus]